MRRYFPGKGPTGGVVSEGELSLGLFGRTECSDCGRWVLCIRYHQCSTEVAAPVPAPVVDREPIPRITPWRERAKV